MERPMTHDEIGELLGAFALDAVEADEALLVAEHIASCPRCAAEVDRHRATAALLANSGGDAPGALWDRISVRLVTPTRADRNVPDSARRAVGGAPAPGDVGGEAPAGAARFGSRRESGRHRPVTWMLGAVAAAAAVVIALLAVDVGRLDGRVGSLSALAARQGIPALAEQAMANPAATRVTLTATTSHGRAAAYLVILPSGTAFLVRSALPALPAGKTYQLWGVVGGRAVSLGLLGRDPQVVPLSLDASAGVTRYAVTAEPAGGVVVATNAPVAEGTVTGA